jgi:hypothetical protein
VQERVFPPRNCNAQRLDFRETASMSDSQALRVTSDALLRDLEALILLEEQKRVVPANDPAMVELAEQVHEIAGRVLQRANTQRVLSQAVVADPTAVAPIARVPRTPASILAEWRELERRAQTAPEGSAERTEIEVLASRLRDEYRAAFESATGKNEPDRGRQP